MDRSIYPENGRHNKAAVLLGSMSPDMVEDIISLVSSKGRDLLTDIFASAPGPVPKGGGQARPLAIFSSDYISEEDFEDVFRGFTTIILSNLRKPSYGQDEYEVILKQAFNLPDSIATTLAKRVETFDPVGTGQEGWLNKIYINVAEGIRTAVNWGARVLQLPWENDQSQKYDFDFLFEMKSLGVVVKEMNSRTRLMVGQAMISSSYGVMQMGDVEDGDAEPEVASIINNMNRRQLPSKVMGDLRALGSYGNKASLAQCQHLMNQAGMEAQNGDVVMGEPKSGVIASALEGLKNLSPAKALLLGGALGLAPTVIKSLMNALSKKDESGDPNNAGLYSTIANRHGEDVANSWAVGDIDGIFKDSLAMAGDDLTTGDTDFDEQLGDVDGDIEEGEIAELGDEMGGILKKFRTNVAIKSANRKALRGDKRSSKAMNKYNENQAFVKAKSAKQKAGYVRYNPSVQRQEQDWANDQMQDQGEEMMEDQDQGGGLDSFSSIPE